MTTSSARPLFSHRSLVATCLALLLAGPTMETAQAQTVLVNGKRPTGVASTIALHATDGEGTFSSTSTAASDATNFSLRVKKGAYLGFVSEEGSYIPVVLGIRKGNKTYSVGSAINQDLCEDGQAVGFTVLKKSIEKARFTVTDKFAYLVKLKREPGERFATALTDVISRATTVELGTDCAPSGTAANSGVTSQPGVSVVAKEIRARAVARGDSDEDGIPDLFDSDVDADGILNPYDSSATPHFAQFYVFSNIKADISQTVNSNVGATPTREEVDALLSNLSTLAIEVKGDPAAGELSELGCNSLPYCTTGGTGTVDAVAFPGPAGGPLDADSDGRGELTAGTTGDVQLKTNAELPDLNTGDSLVQVITPTTGRPRYFFRKLDFVFKSTPALKTVTLNPGTDTEATTTITYPASTGMAGSAGNCLDFANPSDESQVVEVVAWRPQRKGIEVLGEGEFVDIGGSEITIDIPNPPCTGGVCTVTRTPNNCSITTYTESDTNLTTDSGKLVDSRGDADADASEFVTFSVDLKACLLESGDAFDVGETVALDLQFRSKESTNGYDNSAIKFCLTRSS